MPNPHGTLAGWSDLSEPGWQERLIAKVNEHQRTRLKGRRHYATPLRSCHLDVTHSVEFAVLMREAAALRGMPAVSYARRAVAAFVAHDLGVPLERLFPLLPRVTPPGKAYTEFISTPDDGQGHGDWKIEGLK